MSPCLEALMRFVLSLAWRDLRGAGRSLWVFCACLVLGVTLIAASGGLFRQVSGALLDDTRALFGGDLEVRAAAPLSDAELIWLRKRSEVSLLMEIRTMLRTPDGRAHLVELQSFDNTYPLYGDIVLTPPAALASALAPREGKWGAALDPVLADRLGLGPGDPVQVGDVVLTVRALITRQPDRSLRADWRGQPVLIAAGALDASGLVQPGSRVAHRYRIKTAEDPGAWRQAFVAAFPDSTAEIQTFTERGERLTEVLGQIASGLLLIGFSALFIGGLGVFNSVHSYLQGKLATLATLRALGMREQRLAAVYLCQILLLASAASLLGAVLGSALALGGTMVAAAHLPLAPAMAKLALPAGISWLFGVLTALAFALPAVGRALSITPAALFRGLEGAVTHTPAAYWKLTAILGVLTTALLLAAVPEPRFGLGFVLVCALLLLLLEGLVRALRHAARSLTGHRALQGRFVLRLALSNLYRPGSALRPSLLSLGSALTLLVASTIVVGALLRTVNETVPTQAPALVFYDVPAERKEDFHTLLAQSSSLTRVELAPLVLGRVYAVNGERLRDSADSARAREARDEHKLSYRLNNFDHVDLAHGRWWPDDYRGPPLVAMEDREAGQLGLKIGDLVRFEILGETVDARLTAIYSQRRLQSRFWFEAIFSDGVLDPFITRYVGAAHLDDAEAIAAQNRIAEAMPGVVSVATAGILNEARTLLGRAGAGLSVIAAVSLIASLLVLASVLASARARQVYDASVLHTLGARLGLIRASLRMEYALLAVLTTVFATVCGGALAHALLSYRLQLNPGNLWWLGAATAAAVSITSLGAGGSYLLRRLRFSPAILLRASG